jgi:hypothetical protein
VQTGVAGIPALYGNVPPLRLPSQGHYGGRSQSRLFGTGAFRRN